MLKTSPGPVFFIYLFFPFTPDCILRYFQCYALEIWQNPSHVIGNWRLRCHSGCITAFDFLWPSPIETIHSCKIAIFPPHCKTHPHVGKCIHLNLLLFFGVCLSILELLGFKYCKWIIYICTVYNFQVHEMDYHWLILVTKKKKRRSTLYIYIYVCV